MIFWKKNKKSLYTEEEVQYIIEQILKETINGENLFEILYNEIKDIVGSDVIQSLYKRIHETEKEVDAKDVKYWMNVLKAKIFSSEK